MLNYKKSKHKIYSASEKQSKL